MPSTSGNRVQFRGGPLDGHVQTVPIANAQLRELVAIPISGELLGHVSGDDASSHGSPTSVAIYALYGDKEPPEYIYLGPLLAGRGE